MVHTFLIQIVDHDYNAPEDKCLFSARISNAISMTIFDEIV